MFLSTLCLSGGVSVPSSANVGRWNVDVSIETPRGVIKIAYHSRAVCCFTILLIRPGVPVIISSAVRQLESDAALMSERSSTIRFWKRRRKNGVAIQSRGSDDTVIKDAKVFTTARRTFGIVWRKNGNNVGARSDNGRLKPR